MRNERKQLERIVQCNSPSYLTSLLMLRHTEYSRANLDRCYEEMTDQDVKSGQLVWDESEQGCGKGQLHEFRKTG
jgi:hypothetical protein